VKGRGGLGACCVCQPPSTPPNYSLAIHTPTTDGPAPTTTLTREPHATNPQPPTPQPLPRVLTISTARIIDKKALIGAVLSKSANPAWREWGRPPVTDHYILRNVVMHSPAVIERLRFMVETGRDQESLCSPGRCLR